MNLEIELFDELLTVRLICCCCVFNLPYVHIGLEPPSLLLRDLRDRTHILHDNSSHSFL